MGLPVIATALEVPRRLRRCCLYGVNSTMEPVPQQGDFGDFTQMTLGGSAGVRGHRWRKPSVSHLQRQLRFVATHQDEAHRLGMTARRTVVQWYGEGVTA